MKRRITGIDKAIYQIKKTRKYGAGYLASKILKSMGFHPSKSAEEYMYDYYEKMDYKNLESELVFWYEGKTYKKLDVKHPKTYNEKVQWLKLYDNTELKSRLADKYAVRSWVSERIGEQYLVSLLGVWESFEDIDFNLLPNSFVLKCNHGSGMNAVIRDKNDINYEDLRKKFDVWMRTDFAAYNFEPHYHSIKRRIIAEEYLTNGNEDLYDYKFWCNNGRCDFIMFLSDRKKGLRMANLDRDWNKLPFVYDHEQIEEAIPKPDNLEKMIELAEVLAKGFAHVRVDFYRLNDGTIKFGEMTFTSMSGVQKWMPEIYDEKVGDMLKLPFQEED